MQSLGRKLKFGLTWLRLVHCFEYAQLERIEALQMKLDRSTKFWLVFISTLLGKGELDQLSNGISYENSTQILLFIEWKGLSVRIGFWVVSWMGFVAEGMEKRLERRNVVLERVLEFSCKDLGWKDVS
ncbi:unnamed protein product [Sphenostylis stenocarpa]|uniref:Uncharacterized protein n=1 Tax=Sphenostylis stenocarpa TaxID=92480 RepID=A0AA86T7P8_9FABA|nr:unnamed protein product [Sphenostylis stenocarpa]